MVALLSLVSALILLLWLAMWGLQVAIWIVGVVFVTFRAIIGSTSPMRPLR